jgi:hypothetical protein
LSAIFAEIRGAPYGHGGRRDTRAVSDLLTFAGGDLAEIERRARDAFGENPGWRRADSFGDLAKKWNSYTPNATYNRRAIQPVSDFSDSDDWES